MCTSEDMDTAYTAAKAVKVTYTDVKPPVLTIKEAVQAKMIFPPQADDFIVGDADGRTFTSFDAAYQVFINSL